MFQNIGIPGLLLIAVVVLVLFGKGKVSSLMGEVGKGITAFKRGVSDGTAEIEREKIDSLSAEIPPVAPKPMTDPLAMTDPLPGVEARKVTPPSDQS